MLHRCQIVYCRAFVCFAKQAASPLHTNTKALCPATSSTHNFEMVPSKAACPLSTQYPTTASAPLGYIQHRPLGVHYDSIRHCRTVPSRTPPLFLRASPSQGPVEGTGKYDYRYTGRHDHGTLPALKTGGPHRELVESLLVRPQRKRVLASLLGGALAVAFLYACWRVHEKWCYFEAVVVLMCNGAFLLFFRYCSPTRDSILFLSACKGAPTRLRLPHVKQAVVLCDPPPPPVPVPPGLFTTIHTA